MNIQKRLFELSDEKNADFSAKLTPGIDREKFLGVRIPASRKLAKEIIKENEHKDFLNSLPHKYYDENILHSILISEIKDYNECIKYVDEFLPYVDNWAVCDTMSPKAFKNKHERLMNDILRWVDSDQTYTIRFGLKILMAHFLDNDFKNEYLKIPAKIKSDEYYINMMIAWFYATALAKQWDSTIVYIENGVLDKWVHNKAIQKARESYRITAEQKEYLKSLKK
ncbi:DNA alkylation repair protein [Eubacterium coprostanoligenes]|uniref:3-methyladenine DNA glycosylase AlkD n=1 Tax=Eubacterium coprostanoligenes TaxID=290054 RepID=A0A1T4MZG2_9FIRM|nr:DNA alkylation repair protein [Eubacterium coprostanoligenes]SJZ72177.1 3-methyladenine DNA glycosylase AlkD [Eubacterium coprostanoligenes]